ncbi:hypothetical protein MMC17_001167 [Xylographa soralifera]|nr:hypothetical protein [Xylographa soralifera]
MSLRYPKRRRLNKSSRDPTFTSPAPQILEAAHVVAATEDEKKNWPGWCEIESEPALFNVMLKQFGVNGVKVREIVSLDDEILGFMPFGPPRHPLRFAELIFFVSRPIYGIIFLFKWMEDDPVKQDHSCPNNVWFANQTVGNACASIALLNIVNNIPNCDLGDHLQGFKDFTASFTPALRGNAIGNFEFIRQVHNSFARKMDMLNGDLLMKNDVEAAKKRSKKSSYNDQSDAAFHFVAFVPVDGALWKLDGLERQPHSLGEVDSEDWLNLVKPDLEARMAAYEDGQIEFAILGLVKDPIINLVHDLASNIKGIQALEARLDEANTDWRSSASTGIETEGISENTLLGPDMHFQIDKAAIESATILPEVQCKLSSGNTSNADFLDSRRELALKQTNLRVAIKEEQASDYHDEDRAAARRHDYGPAIKTWTEFLARKRILYDLFDIKQESTLTGKKEDSMATTSISDLPGEIIQQILLYCSPVTLATFQRVSHKYNALVEPFLWRYQCQTQYRYWDPKHHIKEKFHGDINAADWRNIFAERQRIDRITSSALEGILESQMGRIDKFQRIVECGYDAKDCLLQHLAGEDDGEDVLARRYYSDAVLGCLHRIRAIKEWSQLQNQEDISLERALGAYDMFVLHDREGDFDEISTRLDAIADDIRAEYADINHQSPRQKAISIAVYLRANNLTGIKDLYEYQDLQNNFLGIALHEEDHPSLSLISTAIYCSLAKRLDLEAHACGFPLHVYTIIRSAQGFDLDGNRLPPDSNEPQSMYMDPFRSDRETLVTDLQAQLRSIGMPWDIHSRALAPASTSEIVLRSGRNILKCVQEAHRSAVARNGHGSNSHITLASSFPDMESAFYGALWASLLLGRPPYGDRSVVSTVEARNFLQPIVQHFETHFPGDVSLIDDYIVPLFRDFGEYAQLRETVRVIRAGDSIPKLVQERTEETSEHVKFLVGQVFKHKRYNYIAVIIGWDAECAAGEHWMSEMRVHELPQGGHQSFYHVLGEDNSVRYVAEENIEIITPEIPHNLMPLAGKHFKRWDKQARRFVSNVKDEYPDD